MSVVRTRIARRECIPFVDTSHHLYPLASGSGSVQYFLSRSCNVAYVGIRVGVDFKKHILQGVWVHYNSPPIALSLWLIATQRAWGAVGAHFIGPYYPIRMCIGATDLRPSSRAGLRIDFLEFLLE